LENKKKLSSEQISEIISVLKDRFAENMHRHKGLEWVEIEEKLNRNPDKCWSLIEMERTGGEPDVVGYDKNTNEFVFYDCSAESPKGRRSICYDQAALEARIKYPPQNSAMNMAIKIGVDILTEEEYRALQKLGKYDTKTSSWIRTPADIRKLGGALFCDRRYDTVFLYHNGADSYYAARGFRGSLRV
jgi:hypothetical protein